MLDSENLTEKRLQQMCSSDGATPLMYACMTGQAEIVRALVAKNVDVNTQDYENGWTALMQATFYGHFEIARYLILEAGADVLIPAKNNLTVFDMAMVINLTDTELFRLLADRAMNLGMKPEQIKVNPKNQTSNNAHSVDGNYSNNNWFQRIGSKLTSNFRSVKIENLEPSNKTTDGKIQRTLPANNIHQYGRLIHALPSPNSNPYGATDWLEPIQPPARFRHAVDEQLLLTQRVKNELNASGVSRRRGLKPSKFLKNNSKYKAQSIWLKFRLY